MNNNQKLALGLAGLAAIAAVAKQRQSTTNVAGKTVLVTGGSRGLGFVLAREFAREGCGIVICARGESALEQARLALRAEGARVLAVPCDVTDQAQVADLIQQANRYFGGIDILVNNAGTIQVGPLQNVTLQDFENAMDTMFWGMVYTTLAVLPQMLDRNQGQIVNVTSIGGKVSVPHLLPYACAKFAATGFSEGLRAELSKTGLKVTTIVPGLMRTGSHLNALFKGQQQAEFTWFSLGATLPLISMDAERAARQIVDATKRGEAERVLSIPATVLASFHGLFPGLTSELLGLVNAAL
ncbi:MAG: SDR family NAD(P)-dependent oxidoreductase [Chloroflexi bacterium]|nr:SDR family NAD(P)-dependent oxidoreductase [Chloroflexota bacterium]